MSVGNTLVYKKNLNSNYFKLNEILCDLNLSLELNFSKNKIDIINQDAFLFLVINKKLYNAIFKGKKMFTR